MLYICADELIKHILITILLCLEPFAPSRMIQTSNSIDIHHVVVTDNLVQLGQLFSFNTQISYSFNVNVIFVFSLLLLLLIINIFVYFLCLILIFKIFLLILKLRLLILDKLNYNIPLMSPESVLSSNGDNISAYNQGSIKRPRTEDYSDVGLYHSSKPTNYICSENRSYSRCKFYLFSFFFNFILFFVYLFVYN